MHPIRIWIGATKPRMLRLTGRLADGVSVSNAYVPENELPDVHRQIDAGAAQAGRQPEEIRRMYNLMGVVDLPGNPNTAEALRPNTPLLDADGWVEHLIHLYHDLRMDTFTFWPLGEKQIEQIEVFAGEIVPATRQELDKVIRLVWALSRSGSALEMRNHDAADSLDRRDWIGAEWRAKAEVLHAQFDQVLETRNQVLRCPNDADTHHALIDQTPRLGQIPFGHQRVLDRPEIVLRDAEAVTNQRAQRVAIVGYLVFQGILGRFAILRDGAPDAGGDVDVIEGPSHARGSFRNERLHGLVMLRRKRSGRTPSATSPASRSMLGLIAAR